MERKSLLLTAVIISVLSAETLACTTFLMSGKYTADGRPLLFKNRDTDEMQNAVVLFTDGRYRYLGLVNGDASMNTMVWGGYNETGFAIINSAAYNNNIGDTTRLSDLEGVVMKLALAGCRTLGDFERLLDSLPKPLGVDANFGVIDAYGGAAFYETGNYRYRKVDANDPAVAPLGLLVRTNHSMNENLKSGFGFTRYNTATAALEKAIGQGSMTPPVIFQSLSRNLYHSLTKTDLLQNIPEKRNEPDFRFFIDFIPRQITASAILISGAAEPGLARETVMWTILGFPLTSVAVPLWLTSDGTLPRAVTPGSENRAPLCEAALRFKEECFPITWDRGLNYINLSAVINREESGYMQLLAPVEEEIAARAATVSEKIHEGKSSHGEITRYYKWLDDYLGKSYSEIFGYRMFRD